MKAKIHFESIGCCLPSNKITTEDLLKDVGVIGIRAFESGSGIKERRFCSEHEDTFTLGLNASLDCLARSKYEPEEIEMIISCSISKYKNGLSHQYEPTISSNIKMAIHADKAITFDISNACAGMMTAVYIAEQYISTGLVNNCMIVSGEYISHISKNAIHAIKSIQSPQMASLTVGDAGAAVIVEKIPQESEGISINGFSTICKYNDLCVAQQSRKFQGGIMKTKVREIQQVSIAYSISMIEKALHHSNLTYDQIDYIIPHQTSKSSILLGKRNFTRHFRNPKSEIVINLKKVGNTASTSHFIALYNYLQMKKFNKGDAIMLLCFASGINIGSIVFKMNDLVEKYGCNN